MIAGMSRPGQTSSTVVIADEEAFQRVIGGLFDPFREIPYVLVTRGTGDRAPALPLQSIRDALGPIPRIYFIATGSLLRKLRARLGSGLMVNHGAVRIFWPGVTLESDPYAHPLVPVLEDEPVEATLQELARRFDLSRPRVRAEIRLIEDARSMLESAATSLKRDLADATRQRDHARNQLRTMTLRAEAAERALAAHGIPQP